MPSATDFLPLCITMLMKREMSWLPCFGSGSSSRVGVLPFLDMIYVRYMFSDDGRSRPINGPSTFGALGAVLGAALAALGDARGVERAAHRVVAHAGQILDAAAADQHDRVLLQVVAFAADVADDFETVRQANLGDLAQRRVRLLRRRRVDARANAATLRAILECRRSALVRLRTPRLAHQLIDCRHSLIPETKRQTGATRSAET